MKKYILVIYVVIASCSGNGQVANKGESLDQVIYSRATEMTEAYKNINLKVLYKYTYKSDLKGKSFDEFKTENIPSMKQMKADKVVVDNFTLSIPSPVVKCNGEMQTVLKRVLYMSSKVTSWVVESNIIGISVDNGVTWTFINGGKSSIAYLKKLYPNLCDDLIIKD